MKPTIRVLRFVISGRRLVLAVPFAWMLLLLGTPLVIIVAIGFALPRDGVPPFSFALSLDNLALVAGDPAYRNAVLHSIRVAFVTTALCLVFAFPAALAMARAQRRYQTVLLLMTMLPFWTGFLMRISAWMGLLADNGFIARALGRSHLLYTEGAMYVGLVYTYVPFMVLPLYARLGRLDPALREAAIDLGAPPWAVFRDVIVPLSFPGILAGSALVFVPVLGEYVIPTLLGPSSVALIGTVLWQEFFANRDWPTAAAVALWLLILLVAVPALALSLRRPGAGDRPAQAGTPRPAGR